MLDALGGDRKYYSGVTHSGVGASCRVKWNKLNMRSMLCYIKICYRQCYLD
jgi:hypothetical protein